MRSLPISTFDSKWAPPVGWTRIQTFDAHTEGEPLRVIYTGFPDLPGETILARRRYAREHFDDLRTALMWEPRGHADMYGVILVPAVSKGADFGVLFTHNEGFSTMCGHGIIGVTKVVLETGMFALREPMTTLRIDTPAGLVVAYAQTDGNNVISVAFRNVPSFVASLDEKVEVPGLATVRYDLAFGGAFYAFVSADELGLTCSPEHYRQLIETGMAIKRAIMACKTIAHPFEDDLSFLYGTIFIGPPHDSGSHSRNVCVFAEGEVDRCPTGTGVSARMAIHYARGEVGVGESIVIESIIGSKFTGSVIEETTFGPYPAVVPQVEGRAFITGRHEFVIDPGDPFKRGFLLH